MVNNLPSNAGGGNMITGKGPKIHMPHRQKTKA